MTTKFKLQGVGIDTSTIKFNPGESRENEQYSYIKTKLEANNDYLLVDYIKSFYADPALFVETDHLDNVTDSINYHLETIGRAKVDVLMVSPLANLEFLTKLDSVSHYGISYPLNLEDLKNKISKFEEKEIKIEYVEIPVCPLDFDLDIIKYCRINNIYLVGSNIFGGHLSAARNIDSFSVPYILGFASTYSDIIFLSGRDTVRAAEDRDHLIGLIGEDTKPEYVLKKSIKKPVKELKKAIYTSITMKGKENMIIPYDDPELAVMPEDVIMNLGGYKEILPDPNIPTKTLESTKDITDEIPTDKVKEVSNFLNIVYYPSDGTDRTKFMRARYKALEYLKTLYPDGTVELTTVGSSLLLISITESPKIKGHLFWKRLEGGKTWQYYLVSSPNKSGILFKEVYLDEIDEKEMKNELL